MDIEAIFYENPMIMAIKDNKDLRECLKEEHDENRIVFVLYGTIETVPTVVKKLKSKDKVVFVHEGLIEGLSSTSLSTVFIKKYTEADGIITTRYQTAYEARKIGLASILRFFLIDSLSYENAKETIKKASCDALEILPGLMPKVIEEVRKRTAIPIIAGGLVREKSDVIEAINAGAIAVSSSNYNIWKI